MSIYLESGDRFTICFME